MTAETASLLIADSAEKITADLPYSQRFDAIKSSIAKLREMHEEMMDEAASAAAILSSEYFEK